MVGAGRHTFSPPPTARTIDATAKGPARAFTAANDTQSHAFCPTPGANVHEPLGVDPPREVSVGFGPDQLVDSDALPAHRREAGTRTLGYLQFPDLGHPI